LPVSPTSRNGRGLDAARAEAIEDEVARRSFPGWARQRFHILNKRERDELLVLNRPQRELLAAEARMLHEAGRARLMALKGRQGGVTTYAQARALHAVFEEYGAAALTVADTGQRTTDIFDKVTGYAVQRYDPRKRPVLGKARTHEITVPALSSSFYTATAGTGDTGLGLTLRRIHGSEFAFWEKPRATLNAMAPSVNRDGTTILLETTASVFGSEAHAFWREARDGKNGYRAIFIPWWLCDPLTYRAPLGAPDELGRLEEDETLLHTRHGVTLEELKWRRLQIREYGGRDEFLQQYPEDDESCWLSAGGMYFSGEHLKALLLQAPAPLRIERGGELEVFSELQARERAIGGCDTAEGVGGDSATIVFRAFPSWRLLRTYTSNTVRPKEFAAIVNEEARGLGRAFLVIEKNMHGITVLTHLRDDHRYPVQALYHRQPLDQAQREAGARIGWATTEESKPLMLSAGRELLTAAVAGHAGVPCAAVLRDAFQVRRDDKGRYDLNGKDLLVAEMLCWLGRTPAPGGASGFADFARAKRAKPIAEPESDGF